MNVIEKEKSMNQKFAEKNGISEDKMETIYEEIFESLPDEMDEDTKTVRALRKVRGTLRRRIQAGKDVDGVIFFRFRNQDYNLFAWNKVDEFVKENGLEKAQELGKADADGNYLHTTGFSAGEIINRDAVYGSAIGVLEDENGKVTSRWISIGQMSIKQKIPLCQELVINVKEGNKPGPILEENLVYYNDCTVVEDDPVCDEDSLNNYKNIIKKMFGDIIFNDFAELRDYCDEHLSDKYHFAGTEAICTNIGVQQDTTSNIPVEFEMGEETVMTLWIKPEVFEGLPIEEGLAGILLVNGYPINKDDGTTDIGFNVGGFIPHEDF